MTKMFLLTRAIRPWVSTNYVSMVDERDDPCHTAPSEERLMTNHDWTLGCNHTIRSQQKGVVQTNDATPKPMLPVQTIFDPSAGICAPEKVCIFFPRNLRFVECEIHIVLFEKSLIGVVEGFARQIFSWLSDINNGADVQAAENVLLSSTDDNSARQRRQWGHSKGRVRSTHYCLAYIIHFPQLLQSTIVDWHEEGFPLSQWLKMVSAVLYDRNVILLSGDCGKAGVAFNKMLIWHQVADLAFWAGRTFLAGYDSYLLLQFYSIL